MSECETQSIQNISNQVIATEVQTDHSDPISHGRNDKYICQTCKNYMMKKKIPPMAAINNLILNPHEEDSQLTELEGALISKNLILIF